VHYTSEERPERDQPVGEKRAWLRALGAADQPSCLALAEAVLVNTDYLSRTREILNAACAGHPEWRATGAFHPATGAFAAVAAFGPVAGAEGPWRLGALLFAREAARREVADPLILDLVATAQHAGARLLMAELPADEAIGFSISALRANGFRQEARIPDFYRDGIAQLFLRRDLMRDSAPAR
jgi:hypothetical protein